MSTDKITFETFENKVIISGQIDYKTDNQYKKNEENNQEKNWAYEKFIHFLTLPLKSIQKSRTMTQKFISGIFLNSFPLITYNVLSALFFYIICKPLTALWVILSNWFVRKTTLFK